MEKIIKLALEELVEKYQPHTVILYGSRATNEATETSDIDLACFCDHGCELKDARLFNGIYLDAWIYPTSAMTDVPDEALRFHQGVLLRDPRGLGAQYLGLISERLADGPEKISETDLAHLKVWLSKMLNHATADSLDGRYRRTWLQYELLEIYFHVRGLWFCGHKKSFKYLKNQDPKALELFELVYSNPTDCHALAALADYVVRR